MELRSAVGRATYDSLRVSSAIFADEDVRFGRHGQNFAYSIAVRFVTPFALEVERKRAFRGEEKLGWLRNDVPESRRRSFDAEGAISDRVER